MFLNLIHLIMNKLNKDSKKVEATVFKFKIFSIENYTNEEREVAKIKPCTQKQIDLISELDMLKTTLSKENLKRHLTSFRASQVIYRLLEEKNSKTPRLVTLSLM